MKTVQEINEGDKLQIGKNIFQVNFIDPLKSGGRTFHVTNLKNNKKGSLKIKFLTPSENGLATETLIKVID